MASIVLVTGCSKGIGQGIALHLAKDPKRRFKVYASMRDTTSGSIDIKSKAGSALDDTLFIMELDVTKQETIDKTVKAITDKEGTIDILVNNAGITNALWWETAPMDTYMEVMNVNYFGCVRMTKAVVPIMKARRNGRILQIGSVLGIKAIPAIVQYVSSKFALEGFSEAIAPPLREFNVWVSLIEPGYVLTPLVQQFGGDAPKIWHGITSAFPVEDGTITARMLTANPDIVIGTEVQSIEDISKLIEEVIVSPKPDFRIQTSQTSKRMAQERLVDPTGNDMMDLWMKK